MDIVTHIIDERKIAELIADEVILASADDGLTILGNLYYQGYDAIILHTKNISPLFFDLKSGIAGEVLQKFSNYRVRLAIAGDFSGYTAKSFVDFVRESNKVKQVNFVGTIEEALSVLSN